MPSWLSEERREVGRQTARERGKCKTKDSSSGRTPKRSKNMCVSARFHLTNMWIQPVSEMVPIKSLQRAGSLSRSDTTSHLQTPLQLDEKEQPTDRRFMSWTKETVRSRSNIYIKLHSWLSNLSPDQATWCLRGWSSGSNSKNRFLDKHLYLRGWKKSQTITVCWLQSEHYGSDPRLLKQYSHTPLCFRHMFWKLR